ncbi:MAG: glycosyltransferase family 2 protein [Planctomycetes bacterium]|nr:glycosyltransferase family 2 protein [Planctomycetota bacterium]
MWLDKRVSVILPTYNEKDSIRSVVERFFATGLADEVIVVNNNAAPGTSEEVAGTGAREIFETRQGYGWACRRGLAEATGDILVLCEPDDTFEPNDLKKLLVYSEDFPYVLGTRTTKEFIWNGANMGHFLRWGNWAVAKQVEVLFNSSILTDVGCTFRAIHRESYLRVRDAFAIGDSHFGPHLTLLMILAGVPFTEISVHYRPRIGESMVTGSLPKAVKLGLRMISMISQTRVTSWLGLIDASRLIPYPEPIPRERAEAFQV